MINAFKCNASKLLILCHGLLFSQNTLNLLSVYLHKLLFGMSQKQQSPPLPISQTFMPLSLISLIRLPGLVVASRWKVYWLAPAAAMGFTHCSGLDTIICMSEIRQRLSIASKYSQIKHCTESKLNSSQKPDCPLQRKTNKTIPKKRATVCVASMQ